MGTILIGTCGYCYKEWVGPFYPAGTRQEKFLEYYTGHFPTVELDYTYYRMPTADNLRHMLEGPGLTFALKATDVLTHRVNPANWQGEAKAYLTAIEPMLNAGRLEAVLFQFPNSFHYTDDNRRHLDKLLKEFAGVPSVVEFRNAEWGNNRVFEELKKRGIAYASTDLPDVKGLPPVLDVSTSSLAYFRLHGRNAEAWWKSGDSTARYDYFYEDSELKGVAERIKLIMGKAAKLLIYFSNHIRGQAVKNAKTLTQMIAS